MNKQKKGFTLLEILVVIGIIAVLIGMGAVSYSTSQKKARDAKRKADVQAIKNAFEQYYSVCNFAYPAAVAATYTCSSPSVTVATNMPTAGPLGAAAGDTYTYTAGSPGSICTGASAMEAPVGQHCVYLQQ